MLPPANRLRKEKEIKRVLASKRSCKNGLLICKTAPNGLEASRFCFVVSKKISNKAVVRNRLKRRLREAVAEIMPKANPGIDCVLLSLSGLENKEYCEVAAIVQKVLAGSGVV
jgi:ribonuclease P protein component